MISLVEGEGVGAGKSYYACTVVAAHIADGGTVYSNDTFQLDWPGFVELLEREYGVTPERDQWRVVPDEEVFRLHEITPPGTEDCPLLIVIDETQGSLNTRDTTDKRKRSFFDWLCQSRHDNNDLLFITQNINNIDVQMRRLASHTMRVFNMATIEIPGFGRWPFKQFLWKKLSGDGKQLQSWKLKGHNTRVFRAYVSKACQGKHSRLMGDAIGRRKLAKAKPKTQMKFILLVVIGAVVGLFFFFKGDPLRKNKDAAKPVAANVVGSSSGVAASPSAPQAKDKPTMWRTVTEEFRGTDGATYLRTAEGGTYEVGTMTGKGFVEDIRGRVVRVLTPEGGRLYIVGHDYRPPGPGPAMSTPAPATPAPAQTEYVGAKWEPVKSELGERESERIKEELKRPIGFKASASLRR